MKLEILNWANEKVGDVSLNPDVFGVPVREDILARVIHWQLAKRRSGNHAVKERGDVEGSTRKIYKQKGTGGARHGARKGAQFRGGGIIFGPVTRDHGYKLPKKIRALGLKVALSVKASENRLMIMDSFDLDQGKTSELTQNLKNFDIQSALFIDVKKSDKQEPESFLRASSNIHSVDFLFDVGANVYDIIRKNKLVLTKDAVEALEARLS